MRKLGLFVGLTLFALAGSARAEDETSSQTPASESAMGGTLPVTEAAPAAPAAAEKSKIQVGVAFLPMLLGSVTAGPSSDNSSTDLSPAYGVGLTASYRIIAGLSVGIAPQFLFHVKDKNASDSAKEYDLMARIAYDYNVIPELAVYAEVLPGYSIISFPDSTKWMGEKPPSPKGFVVGFGVGAAYDVSNQVFVNVGVGYQLGFQTLSFQNTDYDNKTKFLRLAIGGGMKF